MRKKISKSRKLIITIGAVFLLTGVVGILISYFADRKFSLDNDQFGSAEFIDISGEEYEKLLSGKKSFLVFVDQDGCITADGLERIVIELQNEKNLKIYRIMFADARETSMHNYVKFYPSLVIVGNGEVKSWLKADADEDTERFKNKTELENWLNNYIGW